MLHGVGANYPFDLCVVSWFSSWFMGFPLGDFVMASNKIVKAQKTVDA